MLIFYLSIYKTIQLTQTNIFICMWVSVRHVLILIHTERVRDGQTDRDKETERETERGCEIWNQKRNYLQYFLYTKKSRQEYVLKSIKTIDKSELKYIGFLFVSERITFSYLSERNVLRVWRLGTPHEIVHNMKTLYSDPTFPWFYRRF